MGARNLQECLLLQISPKNEAQNRARTILEEYFEENGFILKEIEEVIAKLLPKEETVTEP